MAPRATWKGYIRLAELAFPVSLYAAATTSKRVSFHILNRDTGHRVSRQYVDEETGKPVERENQVKGYETGKGQYIVLQPEEIAEAVPESDKTIRIEAFIECPDVDNVYFDKPYYLAPPDGIFADSFAVMREGMRKKKVAALARAVLFRRVRTVMLRAQGPGLVAHTLNFDYEVRAADEVFADLPETKIEGEMLDLAKHIIGTKAGKFDPREFDDRYDQALAELVKAKMDGRELPKARPKPAPKVASLMDALRESAKAAGKSSPGARKTAGQKKAAESGAKPKKVASGRKTASAGTRRKEEPAQRRKAG